MNFLPDGRLAMLDNKNKSLLIRDEQMKILGRCKFSTLPLSIVVVSEDVAITFGGESVNKCLHVTVTKIIRTPVPYNTISLMNDTTFRFSTISLNFIYLLNK